MASIDREDPKFAAEIARRDRMDGMAAAMHDTRLPFTPSAPAEADFAGRLSTPQAVLAYMAAGRATVTVVSRSTGARFTFRFTRPAEDAAITHARPLWVSVLAGADNESAYTYLGTAWPALNGDLIYRHGTKSRVSATAPSARAVAWMVRLLHAAPHVIMEQAEFWHAGSCGRCGRRLTVPASIGSGFGPECIKHVARG